MTAGPAYGQFHLPSHWRAQHAVLLDRRAPGRREALGVTQSSKNCGTCLYGLWAQTEVLGPTNKALRLLGRTNLPDFRTPSFDPKGQCGNKAVGQAWTNTTILMTGGGSPSFLKKQSFHSIGLPYYAYL